MKATEIFNGTNGTLWLSTDTQEVEVGSIQNFTLKQKNNFEDVDEANNYGKKRRFVGFELSGTISKFKVDNSFINIMEEYKNGNQPDISLIGKVENPTTNKIQRMRIKGVTFDEMDLIAFEQKKATTEEIPFEAEDYNWIDNS